MEYTQLNTITFILGVYLDAVESDIHQTSCWYLAGIFGGTRWGLMHNVESAFRLEKFSHLGEIQ